MGEAAGGAEIGEVVSEAGIATGPRGAVWALTDAPSSPPGSEVASLHGVCSLVFSMACDISSGMSCKGTPSTRQAP